MGDRRPGAQGSEDGGRGETAFKGVGKAPELAARCLAWRAGGPAADGGLAQVLPLVKCRQPFLGLFIPASVTAISRTESS